MGRIFYLFTFCDRTIAGWLKASHRKRHTHSWKINEANSKQLRKSEEMKKKYSSRRIFVWSTNTTYFTFSSSLFMLVHLDSQPSANTSLNNFSLLNFFTLHSVSYIGVMYWKLNGKVRICTTTDFQFIYNLCTPNIC